MIANEIGAPFDQIARNLGYRSARDFARVQLQSLLEQKIAYYQSRIDVYEAKYGMDFAEFRRRVVEPNDPLLSKFDPIQKELDDNDWDDALDFVSLYAQDLARLQP